jgi:hypothetical protein
MDRTPTQQLCVHLRTIVELLERGDRGAAATEAKTMQALIGALPSEISDRDLDEVNRLLEKYATLGEQLRQETLASMTRLGAARRLAAYGRKSHRP